MRFGHLVLAAIGIAVVVAIGACSLAFAQDIAANDIAAPLCANDGALLKWLLRGFATIGGAAIITNSKTILGLPVIGPILGFVGANWAGWLRIAASEAAAGVKKTAAIILAFVAAGFLLSACAFTGDVNADMATFATEVQAYNADLQTKSAAFNSGLLTDAKVLGQAACGTGNELDGLFKAYTPVMLVAGVDPRVAATEAGAKVALDLSCAIVDKADPSTPAATINSAVAQALQAVQTTQAALATGAPGLAAIVTAPLPAATPPAAPATGPPAPASQT